VDRMFALREPILMSHRATSTPRSKGTYTIQDPSHVVIGHGEDSFPPPPKFVQQRECMHSLVKASRQTTKQNDVILLTVGIRHE
jgi:hypothetical protein